MDAGPGIVPSYRGVDPAVNAWRVIRRVDLVDV